MHLSQTAAAHTGTLGIAAILSLGFLLGIRHATDADHVVAISTIVSRERRIRGAALVGALWGAGHTLTILAVGAGIILFSLVIPPRLGLSMEFSVGLMLVALGLLNLLALRQPPVPVHTHQNLDSLDRALGHWTFYQFLRPLVVGLVHGLAGSAAVALLVLTTLRDPHWAAAYLFLFGIGTIAGMMLITVILASALRFAGARSAWINARLSVVTGLLSVSFGSFIVYQMGFVHGLFTANPSWTPQ